MERSLKSRKRTPEAVKRMLCLVLGHREYSDEVLKVQPWEDPDFYNYSMSDFREAKCLRCGEPLEDLAA